MSGKDFNEQNPSRNPFSDFVFDWKSENPDLNPDFPIERTLRQIFSTLFCEMKPDVTMYRSLLNV